jgi:glycosyltransferase involved in cell wall biosynthesis
MMQAARDLGWNVTNLATGHAFHPAYNARADEARALLAVNNIAAAGPDAPLAYLTAAGVQFDAVLLAVVPGASSFMHELRRLTPPHAVIIFDTIELTFVSMLRAARLRRSETLFQQARNVQARQLQIAAAADYTLVVTPEEADLLQRLCPTAQVRILSNIHTLTPVSHRPAERRDLLFVGNFVHMPNRDAVQHFVADIWPQVRAHLPDAIVKLVGLPVAEVAALAAPDVIVAGHVPDLAPFYTSSRLAIAPLRFGAGVKGKVLEAMGYGLPVVMTPIAAEGTHARPNIDALIATTPADFAAATVRLYHDDDLWQRLSQNGQALVAKWFLVESVQEVLVEMLDMAMRN